MSTHPVSRKRDLSADGVTKVQVSNDYAKSVGQNVQMVILE